MDLMSSIKYLQHVGFFTFTTGILDSRHFSQRQTDVPLRVLEIGCGPGDFAHLLKNHYKEKISLTALDPSECAIKQAQSKNIDVAFHNKGILDWQPSQPDNEYDVVIFTKSLHHCDELEKCVQRARNLLAKDGVLLVEELQLDNMDTVSINWMFDRIDLLTAANRLSSHGLHPPHTAIIDRTIPGVQRWGDFLQHRTCHPSQDVKDAIYSVFGKENTKLLENVPFMHYFLPRYNLEDSDIGKSILTEFMAQEDRALVNNTIKSPGFNVVAEK
ncbi:S-adenosyl-L-methionine-dependent methyltransferase [Absidia repens]|uniref:S-adenosyl-L-methionine-dependent methyltransferase n=1 Tax=Absidia repens TaxID=90262 RepID=A0A1X2IMX2_9FUNG|nr:S-adenosyl-L-methionine-dependent methyltransferase [Absidia repens]